MMYLGMENLSALRRANYITPNGGVCYPADLLPRQPERRHSENSAGS